MAPRKRQPTTSITVRLPVDAAGELAEFCARHGGEISAFVANLVERQLVEIRRTEGIWPDYPNRDRKPTAKRANLRPEVV
mgnify:CR=1 FL=1